MSVTDANGNTLTEPTDYIGPIGADIAFLNPLRYRGYVYDNETGLYLTGTRYYDPEIGRFINADGYVSTGQGVLGNNMFAYCLNNPVNMSDPTGEFAISATLGGIALWKIGVAIVGLVGTFILADTIAKNPPAFPSISLPKVEEKYEVIPAPPPSNGTTYYHVTTPDNAAAIMATGVMTGSIWESGYVYAWKTNPSKYAIENSGAHMGVTISFKTSASFVMDTGITDPKVQMYVPVVSTVPGPIVVWDVQIVG